MNHFKLGLTSLASLLIMSGVSLKNTGEQLGEEAPYSQIGPAFFVLGWVLLIYSLSLNSFNELKRNYEPVVFSLCGLAIVVSVFMMKKHKKESGEVPVYLPVIFASGWLLLGVTFNKVWGLFAAVLVLLSMLVVLPWQREKGVIDGPGMNLFTMAFAIISIVNAIQ